MEQWRSNIQKYKAVHWLLTFAILLMAISTAHIHLHHSHSDIATEHQHVVDLHLLADTSEQSHHDEDTNIIDATPDVVIKKSSFVSPLFALLVSFVITFLLTSIRTSFKPCYTYVSLKQILIYFAPPLRAPPAH